MRLSMKIAYRCISFRIHQSSGANRWRRSLHDLLQKKGDESTLTKVVFPVPPSPTNQRKMSKKRLKKTTWLKLSMKEEYT